MNHDISQSELLPDEELPRQLDAAEQLLATSQHRWFARATLLAAIATGITLLLPWSFSRRLGLSGWQLGIEDQPKLGLIWLAGLATSIAALVLRSDPRGSARSRWHLTEAAAAITGVVAVVYIASSWQANTLDAVSDSWPGPGPAFAIVTGLIWLLCATAQLIADHPPPSPPTDENIQQAIARLRRFTR